MKQSTKANCTAMLLFIIKTSHEHAQPIIITNPTGYKSTITLFAIQKWRKSRIYKSNANKITKL